MEQLPKAIEVSDGKAGFLETQSTWNSGGGGEDEAPHPPGGFRAGQLMVGLVLGEEQGAQGSGQSSRTHSPTVQGAL